MPSVYRHPRGRRMTGVAASRSKLHFCNALQTSTTAYESLFMVYIFTYIALASREWDLSHRPSSNLGWVILRPGNVTVSI
jgi:hypothetical protein